VNICLLGVAMMLFLKKSRRESQLMGMAGLFHDLGMTRLPDEILNKPASLTPEEWDHTKRHPTIGVQLLKSSPAMPAEGLHLVQEHHENADGSGYPLGIPLRRQHPWSRIIRLLDAYDAITSHRVYRPGQSPYAALKTLQEQEGPQGPVFDPHTLKNFIRFLALS
jgi:HD-GYP domain-containing protein (c-di-GMP phosphodiesterase class II)